MIDSSNTTTKLSSFLSFFQDFIEQNIAYYRTKFNIEKKHRHFGWAAFWHAKKDYPAEHLQKFSPFRLTIDIASNDDEIRILPSPGNALSASTQSLN